MSSAVPLPGVEHLRELVEAHPAWWDGAPGAGDPSPVTGGIELTELGRGESYIAYLARRGGAELVLRVPHKDPAELDGDPAAELATLARVPAGLGAAPIAVHNPEATPGASISVTTRVPGRMLPAAAWDDPALLRRLAQRLAVLHVHGDTAGLEVPERIGPVAAAEDGRRWWQEHEPASAEALIEPLWPSLLARLEQTLPAFDGADRVLLHGDPAASNLLVDEGGEVRFVDWEWAQVGDAARDLAFIGGPVAAEPWYAVLTPARVRAQAEDYLTAREAEHAAAGLAAPDLDLEALLVRREAHLLQEVVFTAAHLHRVGESGGERGVQAAATSRAMAAQLRDHLG